MITRPHCQEALSRAYVHALAASAGVNFNVGNVYDYGIDGQFKPVVERIENGHRRLIESGFNLDFQLKSSVNWQHDGDNVVFDLEAKTYNDLVGRDPDATGIILILLCLPADVNAWAAFEEERLTLQRCCYYLRVVGDPTGNEHTIRITIPRANVLTAESLRALLDDERARHLVP